MAIKIKTAQQIERMRAAGRVVRKVLDRLGEMVQPGVTTEELDREAERLTIEAGALPLFRGVPGRGKAGPFPACICSSINHELVHGIPSKRRIEAGDIVSIDFGVKLDGWCGDSAMTYIVGEAPQRSRHLVDVTQNVLSMAISMIKPGVKWSQIARVMQDYVESEGFSVVREFVGHGIGSEMWEDPKVPNFVSRELELRDIVLAEGMVIAIEPMVNMGSPAVEYAADGWTVVTRDRKPAAHFEHTVAVVTGGVSVLTDGK